MFRVENKYEHYAKSVKVEWNLGKRCNYDCSYCPAEIHDMVSPHTDIKTLKKAVDELAKIENVRISLTGGEPFVHPDITALLDYARPKVTWINVTTNGTRTKDFYVDMLSKYLDHIVFSLHFEYDWERILETIISVYNASKNKMVLVHVMMLNHRLNDVTEACRRLSKANIPYALRPIRWTEAHDIFEDLERYSKEELDFLKTENHNPPVNTLIDGKVECNVNDLLINKTNKFKGWSCTAGLESLMVNWDGDVHRATCRVGGSLGNIYKGTFKRPTENIICTRDWCTCAADINLTKYTL
jgi:MoaA/NifB/PqqE/SkfB family radical SAM enzyme